MGEFHGQILGILIVVTIFAVIIGPMKSLFSSLVDSVGTEITTQTSMVVSTDDE